MLSTTFKLPNKNKTILLSIASEEFRREFAESATILQKIGFALFGTPGTAKFYQDKHGLSITSVSKSETESDDGPGTAVYEIKNGKIDLVINVSEGTTRRDEITAGYLIRRAAVDFGVSLVTDVKCAIQLASCFDKGMHKGRFVPRHIGEFYKIPIIGWTNDEPRRGVGRNVSGRGRKLDYE
jgi:carbamoyl-phosphate synthase/aspartate carbamoyltransferase